MRSIRRSLVVYFLVLVAVALGVVSGLVYQTTQQTLGDREQTMRNLLVAQYKDRCRDEEEKLNRALLAQAQTLASLAQAHHNWSRLPYQSLMMLGLLTAPAPTNPNAFAVAPLWAAEGQPHYSRQKFNRVHWTVSRLLTWEIQINEETLPSPDEGVEEYAQIDSEWGNTWRSASLGQRALPVDRGAFAAGRPLDWRFDDTELRPGVPLRRVTLKVPVSRVRVRVTPSQSFRPRPPPPELDYYAWALFIQCARDTKGRDALIAAHRARLYEELAWLRAESEATLTRLGNRLLLVSLLAFAGTAVGGLGLVRTGLAPLRRLSDAVSRVSAKDFRLPLQERRMPRELQPIVGRLTQTLDQLKRAFAREKQAAADISHELRTPLAALLTTTELALRKPRTAGEYRDFFQDVRASGEQISQLVERILTLARLDAGADALRPRSVDVAALAEKCAALVRPLADDRGVTLLVHAHKPAEAEADPDKLSEVLLNLLHNAIEYNRPNGSVQLSVERNNGYLEVKVEDTGIGISRESREQIFERFFRGDPSRQADGLHAGLGLSIVKGYVDLMGGTIAVDSTPGQGSTFRLSFPA